MKGNHIFQSNVIPSGKGLSLPDLRALAQGEPEVFIRKVQAGAESGKLKLSDLKDMRGLYDYLADVPVTVQVQQGRTVRTITASAFPMLTGTLGIAFLNEKYNDIPKVGDKLVREIRDPKKVTTIAAIHSLDKNVDEIKEGKDFPEIGADEEKVEIRHRKNGRKVVVTKEAIEENEVADIVTKFDALAEIASDWTEEQTLLRVTDHFGCGASPAEPYVYRPNGTGTALFSALANTPGKRAPSGNRIVNNALVDETDLTAALTLLANMRNGRGKRIYIPHSELILLVPFALVGKAAKIMNSEYVPGRENEKSNYGPGGMWHMPAGRIINTPKLDDLSATTWYLGAFKRQFTRKWKMDFEYVTLGTDTQAYLNSQIAFQARIAWDMEVGATDYVYVIQCLAAETAPVDA